MQFFSRNSQNRRGRKNFIIPYSLNSSRETRKTKSEKRYRSGNTHFIIVIESARLQRRRWRQHPITKRGADCTFVRLSDRLSDPTKNQILKSCALSFLTSCSQRFFGTSLRRTHQPRAPVSILPILMLLQGPVCNVNNYFPTSSRFAAVHNPSSSRRSVVRTLH